MNRNLALVFYYNQNNKYSFNALAGALETDEYFENLKIYFLRQENELIAELNEILKNHEKVVVGISFSTTQLWDISRIINLLRKEYGNNPLFIAGGPHPTGDTFGTLKLGFDIVVIGEGEETLIELLKTIDNKEDYVKVKGIAFLDEDKKYRSTSRRSPIVLDKYPPFSVKYKKYGPIEITRGCPFVCYFCQTPHILGAKVRHRNVENIVKCVEIMKSKNLKDIRFITPNSFSYGSPDGKELNLSKLENLLSNLRELIRPNGKIFFGSFPSEVRPEHVTNDTIDLVLKYANNDNLIIGAQSGSQRILDLCHRGHTIADIYVAVELTLKAGLIANVDFIFGLPNETEEDINLTINMMQNLIESGARIHAHTFIPLPQTPYRKAHVRGVAIDIRRMIEKLIPKGIIYGDWREQERIARKMSRYLRTGIIEIEKSS